MNGKESAKIRVIYLSIRASQYFQVRGTTFCIFDFKYHYRVDMLAELLLPSVLAIVHSMHVLQIRLFV